MLNTVFFIVCCVVFYNMGVSTTAGEATVISVAMTIFVAYNFFLRSRLIAWIGMFSLLTAIHFIFFLAVANIDASYLLGLARFTSLQLFLTVVYIWLSTPVPKSWQIKKAKRDKGEWLWNYGGDPEIGMEKI